MANEKLRRTLVEKTLIDKNCFLNNDPKALFQFLFCLVPDKFRDVFKPHDIQISTQDDVVAVAQLHEKGIDQEKFKVDFMEVVKKITLTASDLQNVGSCMVFC